MFKLILGYAYETSLPVAKTLDTSQKWHSTEMLGKPEYNNLHCLKKYLIIPLNWDTHK